MFPLDFRPSVSRSSPFWRVPLRKRYEAIFGRADGRISATGSKNRHPSDGKKGGGFEAEPDADVRREKKRFQNGQKRPEPLRRLRPDAPQREMEIGNYDII